MERDNIQLPPLSLLESNVPEGFSVPDEEIADNKEKLLSLFKKYGTDIEKIDVSSGPSVSSYSIVLNKFIKRADYEEIEEYISLAIPYRFILKRQYEGLEIEISYKNPSIVSLRSVFESEAFRNCQAELPVALGYTTDGKVKVGDIAEMPHLLVAGATKQGKTSFIKTIIMSLLYSKKPSEVKFVMIDPKNIELGLFSRLPKSWFAMADIQDCTTTGYQNPIITAPTGADKILMGLRAEMNKRYARLAESNVHDIKTYNKKNPEQKMPYAVIIIDEYADLVVSGYDKNARKMSRNIMTSIISLAQKGRAVGLHVVIATQRPSRDVITGLVKANFPSRVAFRVSLRIDSLTILDQTGAERLNGNGDMLYNIGAETERIQCPYVTNDEIEMTTDYISGHTESDGGEYYLLPD